MNIYKFKVTYFDPDERIVRIEAATAHDALLQYVTKLALARQTVKSIEWINPPEDL